MRCVLGFVIPAMWAGVFVSAFPAFAEDAPAGSAKIGVLIIDGQNNHKWRDTTPAIRAMLEKTGRFTVAVATTPTRKAPKAEWKKFRPEFAKYGAVFLNYYGQPWPAEVNKSFERYVRGGGGLVFYHAAAASFPAWKEFNAMMGMGWRKADQGMRLTVDDSGREVRTPVGEGPGSGHGPRYPYEIVIRDAEHPVTKGLPVKFMHARDELWHGMRGPLKGVHILATGFSDKKLRGTGTNEPLVWTVPYGKGRVFVTVLGHDVGAATAASSAVFIARGLEWAATGKVTLSVPKDLSAKVK